MLTRRSNSPPKADLPKPPARKIELRSAGAWERRAVRRLTGILREIAEATDYQTALAVAKAKGGQKASIAARPPAQGWLAKAVGVEKASLIGAALNAAQTGGEFIIPKGPWLFEHRKAEVLRMTRDGHGRNQIAAALGIHCRTVQLYRARLRGEGVVFAAAGSEGKAEVVSPVVV